MSNEQIVTTIVPLTARMVQNLRSRFGEPCPWFEFNKAFCYSAIYVVNKDYRRQYRPCRTANQVGDSEGSAHMSRPQDVFGFGELFTKQSGVFTHAKKAHQTTEVWQPSSPIVYSRSEAADLGSSRYRGGPSTSYHMNTKFRKEDWTKEGTLKEVQGD
jgi:hypothetical protein